MLEYIKPIQNAQSICKLKQSLTFSVKKRWKIMVIIDAKGSYDANVKRLFREI